MTLKELETAAYEHMNTWMGSEPMCIMVGYHDFPHAEFKERCVIPYEAGSPMGYRPIHIMGYEILVADGVRGLITGKRSDLTRMFKALYPL